MAPSASKPVVVVIGGPNGAGKTTAAGTLLPEGVSIRNFVNADAIAQGLSAFEPETAAFKAGRLMLERLRELAGERRDFAFETTLASRSFAPFLGSLKASGYEVLVYYVWLRSSELAVQRVAERVRRGGHHIPADVIRRRYARGVENFFSLYRPLADRWVLCDNSERELIQVAVGAGASTEILDRETYEQIRRTQKETGA